MSFTSFEFIWFFLAFLVLYAVIPARFRGYALLLGGIVFCWMAAFFGTLADTSLGAEELRQAAAPGKAFLALLTALSFAVINYLFGILLKSGGTGKRIFLFLGVGVNVASLAVFKVTGFLPVGVSYYTFACIAYLVDVYRGTVRAEPRIDKFVTYTTLFPKLLQGPITRYGELAPQLDAPKYTLSQIQSGLSTFVIGFAMKVLLADRLGYLWNDLKTIGFENLSTPLAWLGAFGFSLQLYFDWQGYSLMAVGIGRMLGFNLPQNFNYPYLARSIGDFYRRWHMTLMRWFKDYVYIPLGGNRKGLPRTVIHILLVWLLTSVWHGLGWNFLLWGMSLGLLIVLEKVWLGKYMDRLHVLPHVYVLLLIPLTWVCFAISDPGELGAYFSRLFPFFGGGANVNPADFSIRIATFWPYFAAGIVLCFPFVEHLLQRYQKSWVVSVLLAGLFWWSVYELQRNGSNAMMYMNF